MAPALVVGGCMLALVASGADAQDPVRASSRPTVAIMDFDNGALGRQAEFENFGKGIAGMLITELGANPSIQVVDRAKLQSVFAEQDLSRTDRIDPETAIRVGRTLGVRHMIFGVFIVDLRGRMRLDARAVNVETSEVEYTATKTDDADDLFEIVTALAVEMNKGMKLPQAPPRSVPASIERTAPPARLNAVRLYAAAQTEADKGNRKEAAKLCREALALVPDYAAVKDLLSQLEANGQSSVVTAMNRSASHERVSVMDSVNFDGPLRLSR
jgi:TolB-like protein